MLGVVYIFWTEKVQRPVATVSRTRRHLDPLGFPD
jgi:hypothetical protein